MSRIIGAKCKVKKYDPDVVDDVAALVRSKTISLNSAAKQYGIPKTTLHDRVHGKYPSSRVGPKRTLNDAEESRIVDWAVHMAKIGYGRTRQEVVLTVKRVLDEDDRQTPFRDNLPGKDWLKGFFSRHKELSLRTTLQLGKERAIISPEKINSWFDDFQAYVDSGIKDASILKDPSRLYNADESGFSLCVTTEKVVGYKGAPVVYQYGNSSKQQVTVMACASASGHYCPPMIIYPGQRFSYELLEKFPDAHMGRRETSWMDGELFCHWLLTCFIPALDDRWVKRPVILFIDGHSTHLSLEASNICVDNGIELYCLLEHSSHVMQPLDLRVFSALKKNWKTEVRAYQEKHIGSFVTKRSFAEVFKPAWEKSATIELALKGFMEAGLFPLDPARVTQSTKLKPSSMFQSKPGSTLETPLTESGEAGMASIVPACMETTVVTPIGDAQSNIVATPNEATGSDGAPTSASVDIPTSSIYPVSCHVATQDDALPVATTNGSSTTSPALTDVTNTPIASPATSSSSCAPASPFLKYLKYPVLPSTGKRKIKAPAMPKAITGHAYRQMLQEKRAKKEEEKAKQQRKEERIRKRTEKEEALKLKKLKQAERKRAMQERRRKVAENLVEKAMQSDSDDAAEVAAELCYTCEKQYGSSFIECDKCSRRFHVACVQEDILDGVPFECKYC